ncbi:SUMF1/EgtB/PvdO family nonheme iron enzyme [Candidatus Sumerlaeota bacterium]|nr:SUMF1/EgtB/PvdO family nonheme iron enzyme [Candidatus Sumerlaeota bacterium]
MAGPATRMRTATLPLLPLIFIGAVFFPIAARAQFDAEKRKDVAHPGYGNYTETYGGLEIPMVWLPGGNFIMGRKISEEEARAWRAWGSWAPQTELPQIPGRLNGFWISATEITVKQYSIFVGESKYQTEAEKKGFAQTSLSSNENPTSAEGVYWNNPSIYQLNDQMPVALLSWRDCLQFTKWLSDKTSKHFSLPIEAEWEYAYRAGTEFIWHWGNLPEESIEYEWFERTSRSKPSEVGMLKPNRWGMYDMGGNVTEICLECYVHSNRTMDRTKLELEAENDSNGRYICVAKGMAYRMYESWGRAASRNLSINANPYKGFRIVRIPQSEDEIPQPPATATISGKVSIDGQVPSSLLLPIAAPAGSLAALLGQTPPTPPSAGLQMPELIPIDGNPWRYPIKPEPDGSYSVSVIPGSYVLAYRNAELRQTVCPKTRIDVEEGQSYDHNMNVALKRATIKTESDLSILADVIYVGIHAALGDGHYRYLYGVKLENGKAVIEALPPGEYMIELAPNIFRFYDDPRFTVPEDAPEDGVEYTLPIEGF